MVRCLRECLGPLGRFLALFGSAGAGVVLGVLTRRSEYTGQGAQLLTLYAIESLPHLCQLIKYRPIADFILSKVCLESCNFP